LTILLISLSTTTKINEKLKKTSLYKSIVSFINKVLSNYEGQNMVFLKDKELLLKNIVNHFMTSYFRLWFNVPIDNHLLNGVIKKYNDSFTKIKKIVKELENKLNVEINDDEIAFLTLYIQGHVLSLKNIDDKLKVVIVCPEGIHTSTLIKFELENHFSNKVIILDTLSKRNLSKSNLNPDFIISTENLKERNYVKVSPIFSSIDIHAIENKIKSFEKEHIRGNDLLNIDHIHIVEETKTFEEAIKLSFEKMVSKNIVTSSYVDHIVKKIKQEDIYFIIPPYIALPHANPKYGARGLGIEISLFKEPIEVGDNKLQLFISLAAVDNKQHITVLKDLSKILRSNKTIEEIINSKTKKEVYTIFKNTMEEK
jgi:mannitol/fructose-specific phosphotransferase system IIA component (Ntr-type)/galactitol-specific phosphotransferase system IIB component